MSEEQESCINMIACIAAYLNNEDIESCRSGTNNWDDSTFPTWDFLHTKFRVKNKEKK